MLQFHGQILSQISSNGSGLLILAQGLGSTQILSSMIAVHANPKNLVLLLNTSEAQVQLLQESIMSIAYDKCETGEKIYPHMLKHITNETDAKQRSVIYKQGGVLSVTCRILIVDLLNNVLPTDLISGIIVNNAHKVTETSTETFILRIIREKNCSAFIRAISEEPLKFTSGLWKLEKSLKCLFLRQCYLWPRFHVSVTCDLSKRQPLITEVKVPMTRKMKQIQAALIDCINDSLGDIKRLMPDVEIDEFNLENAFFKSFDQLIHGHLDRIWHRVSPKTRELIADLKILRTLLDYLVTYDSVTFCSFLETILISNSQISQNALRNQIQSPWLLFDAAHTVFDSARQRVYKQSKDQPADPEFGCPAGYIPVAEELPKWQALMQIISEIDSDRTDSTVLVMTSSGRSCMQLNSVLSGFSGSTMKTSGLTSLNKRLIRNYFKLKASATTCIGTTAASAHTNKRRRTRQAVAEQKPDQVEILELPAELEQPEEASKVAQETTFELVNSPIILKRYSNDEGDDLKLLEDLQPDYLILCDPDLKFVRQLEIYQASKTKQVHVFFMIYDNSVQEQKYLSLIRREKDAFEVLIRQNAQMAPNIDQDKRDFIDSLIYTEQEQQQVIVDVREFRSSLPSLLHQSKLFIRPCTLEIGDYIISDDCCIERKSLADLIGSFKSGRLYNQCQQMFLYYRKVCLLVEFDHSKGYTMQTIASRTLDPEIQQNDLSSKLCLLLLAFPKLNLIWSTSPEHSVKIILKLKESQKQPDLQKSMAMGSDSANINSIYNPTPLQVLRSLDGITAANYRHVMHNVSSLGELFKMSLQELIDLIGQENGTRLHKYINSTKINS